MENDIPDTVPEHWVRELPSQVMITDAFWRSMIANPERRIPFLLADA